jgi:hypothetical protein
MLHGNTLPIGKWWRRTLEDVDNIYFINTTRPKYAIGGQPFLCIQHAASYWRLFVLIEYGGIYLDTDILVVRSFDPLRNYTVVMGQETVDKINNGVILAQPGAEFLKLVAESYSVYKGKREQYHNTVKNIYRIYKTHPHLMHVEKRSIAHPNCVWSELVQLYVSTTFNWSSNYCIHVWSNGPKSYFPALPLRSPEELNNRNSTLHRVMKFIMNT